MQPLTTSIYTFERLISGGFLYVDKTALIHHLLQPAAGQYFLSRPRRFGKSLLVSTLKAIFLGRRELFKGLAIDATDYDWQTHPVIHLDLGACPAGTPEALQQSLGYALDDNAKLHGLTLTRQGSANRFRELVEALATRGPVVILVDEYDKPLLGHLGQESAKAIQTLLKEFYAVIKATEASQRFVLLTGVSKFAKVSVFSDLNNLTDLTMRLDCATLLGYTQAELESNFAAYIERLATRPGVDRAAILDRLRTWYNGYRFHHEAPTVYNPVSIMKCFDEQDFKNYWFETGTPSFLIELLKKQPVDMTDLRVADGAFSTYDPTSLAPLPLLVQTGYLTILATEEVGDERYYRLGYPNREIEQAFSRWLAAGFCGTGQVEVGDALRNMLGALRNHDLEALHEELKTFFANVPYDITLAHEKYYQTIFFVIFKLLGTGVATEVRTNRGRIDAVIRTPERVYLFEFKLHGTAKDALEQMHRQGYAEGYRRGPQPVTLIGAAFDPQTRNLGEWLVEPLAPAL